MTTQIEQTSIGGYRITETLGAGGMGVVYVGEHELLRRKAAIKVLLPELSHDPEVVDRFFKEAKAATAIKHPGIVKVYDFGYQDNGSAFIAMEFLEGEALDARLSRLGPLPIAQALRLAGQITSALAAAHDHGIVHRDLKPANVFIVPDPQVTGGERIKLLDFGIAKFSASDDPNAKQTRAGALLGSPQYMAPEQIRGARDIDHRADLYAMGCILFEMLCGQPPFDGGENGALAVMASHLDDPPPVPSSLRDDLFPEIDALILYLLAKEPADRYQTAAALTSAIAAILGEPVAVDSQTDISTALATETQSSVALSPTGVPLSDSQIITQVTTQLTLHGQRTQNATLPGKQTALAQKPIPWRFLAPAIALLLLCVGAAAVFMMRNRRPAVATAENVAPAPRETREIAPEPPPPAPRVEPPAPTYRKIMVPSEDGSGMIEIVVMIPPAETQGTVDWSRTSFSIDRLMSGELFADLITTVQEQVQKNAQPPPDAMITWKLTSSPDHAEILERGKVIGKTPFIVQLARNPDYRTTYVLRARDHDDAEVTLSAGESTSQTITLAPKIVVTIRSKPQGAELFDILGQSWGKTPTDVLLSKSSDPAAFALKLDGYDDLNIEVVPDKKQKITFTLVKKRALVTHRITTEPGGATVLKDGVEVGVTPFEVSFLEEKDKVKYTVELDGYQKKLLRLPGDRDHTESFMLKKCDDSKQNRSSSPVPLPGGRPTIVRVYSDPC